MLLLRTVAQGYGPKTQSANRRFVDRKKAYISAWPWVYEGVYRTNLLVDVSRVTNRNLSRDNAVVAG